MLHLEYTLVRSIPSSSEIKVLVLRTATIWLDGYEHLVSLISKVYITVSKFLLQIRTTLMLTNLSLLSCH